MDQQEGSAIGRRIHVMGNSSSGKSTLAARLSEVLGFPLVELDALNWEPGWVGLSERDPAELERRIASATAGEQWVVAGSYATFCQNVFWGRVDTVVYLDLGVPRLVWRVLRRSWHRMRSQELLWGTNTERFWPQLMVWRREESLVWWIVAQQRRKRARLVEWMNDPSWRHIRFIRLTSPREIESFAESVERTAR